MSHNLRRKKAPIKVSLAFLTEMFSHKGVKYV
nr:MAG TPA: hypothetical protein [Caudoviricetes sp.]